ncbi:uncharacterized protein [Palaemon carinicauda]|uniref:uncharacterized protein n=1 Tax=Palaemon carinicauda TaxID=392227 RepID=UPI0035B6103A
MSGFKIPSDDPLPSSFKQTQEVNPRRENPETEEPPSSFPECGDQNQELDQNKNIERVTPISLPEPQIASGSPGHPISATRPEMFTRPSSGRKTAKKKTKIYQWPKQKDPLKEKRRVKALIAYKHRQEKKKREIELAQQEKNIKAEIDNLKTEKLELSEKVEYLLDLHSQPII